MLPSRRDVNRTHSESKQLMHCSLEQWKIYSRDKQGEWVSGTQNPRTPQWFVGRSSLQAKDGVRALGWMAFFPLVGNRLEGNIFLILRLPSCMWVGTLFPPEELEDTQLRIVREQEPEPYPKATQLLLDCKESRNKSLGIPSLPRLSKAEAFLHFFICGSQTYFLFHYKICGFNKEFISPIAP